MKTCRKKINCKALCLTCTCIDFICVPVCESSIALISEPHHNSFIIFPVVGHRFVFIYDFIISNFTVQLCWLTSSRQITCFRLSMLVVNANMANGICTCNLSWVKRFASGSSIYISVRFTPAILMTLKITLLCCTSKSKSQIPFRVTVWPAIFKLQAILKQVHRMTLRRPRTLKGSPYMLYQCPGVPNFNVFRSTVSRFRAITR